MISLGEKVTDTAYVTGFLRGFFFFFVCLAYFVMERNSKLLLKLINVKMILGEKRWRRCRWTWSTSLSMDT